MPDSQEFLTQKEVADRFRVDVSTVSRWRRTGLLRGLKVGGVVRYRTADVDRMADVADSDSETQAAS